MIDLLRRILTPKVAVVGLLAALVVASVMLADAEGGRQIANDAATQRAAESVLSAAAVTDSAVQQAALTGRAWQEGIATDSELEDAEANLRRRLDELDTRTALLAARTDDSTGLRAAHNEFQDQTETVIDALDARQIPEVVAAAGRFDESYETLTGVATSIRDQRQAHIETVKEGIDSVATAARLAAGLGIPAVVLIVLYRGLRTRQRQVLLRSELEREKALRRSKDQFLSGASHHLNTPLSAVSGFARLLNDGTRRYNASVRNEMTELLAIQAEEATHVAEDLLIAARSNMDKLTLDDEDVNLRKVIEDVTNHWNSGQLARLEVTGNSVARADHERVAQILRNLLRNAEAFGGNRITVKITQKLNRSVVEVVDNGDGIPAGEEEAIFQPYHSARQIEGMAPSLGLGLSVSRRLARSMGGDLKYERDDGDSIFRLILPQGSDTSTQPAVPDLVIDPSAGVPTIDDIRDVIDADGPHMVYQPIIDLEKHSRDEHTIIGYEALARFPYASPPEWFESAKSADLKVDLELSCIRAAIKNFDTEDSNQFLALNISDEALKSSKLVDSLTGIDNSRLVVELSETATIRNYEATRGRVNLLADQGARLAIDDFGAAEIDLWHITRLGVSIIKIDMSLVRELDKSPTSRGLIRAVVALAQELGLMVIAEGVETETEHKHLLDLEVPYGQGYLYGKPQPIIWALRALSS